MPTLVAFHGIELGMGNKFSSTAGDASLAARQRYNRRQVEDRGYERA